MSNEPSRPADDDAPTGAAGDPAAHPDVPPADAERIAASRDAAASADDRELAEPASRADGTGEPGGGGRKILIGVLVVLLIGIVVYGVRYLTSDPANAEVGDCVSVAAEADNRAEVDTLDCSADEASYKVGKVLEATDATCPEDGLYTEIVPAARVGDGYKLCLLPNMAEGACYKPDEGTGFVKTGCTGPETIKVIKVIEGSADLEACPDGAGMAYPEPPVTYCLAPAEM
ncbi:hypothetical protein AB0H12_09810 [Actinosynnema sp. NPDC023794]